MTAQDNIPSYNIRAYKIAFFGNSGIPQPLKTFPIFALAFLCRVSALFSFFSAAPASPPSFPARVQPVNEITRSNLWHQIPNENMIIAANAEYRAWRTGVSRDRRRRQVGTMILSFAFNRSFRTTFRIVLITEQKTRPRKHDRMFSKPSSFIKVVRNMC